MSISTAPPQKKRNALFTALILFLAHVVLAITLFIAGNQLNILEMQQAAMATSIHALIFGASAASMLGGVAVVLADQPIDILSKFVFDLIAIGLFIWFAALLRKRETQTKTNSLVYSH